MDAQILHTPPITLGDLSIKEVLKKLYFFYKYIFFKKISFLNR